MFIIALVIPLAFAAGYFCGLEKRRAVNTEDVRANTRREMEEFITRVRND